MALFNLGSINVDHAYQVPHLPMPGETLAATGHAISLGGKGANQSVAAALAGSTVRHIGAVGPDGQWTLERLRRFDVDVTHVVTVQAPTAHAIINVDPQAENAIVIFSGANVQQSEARIAAALGDAKVGDTLLLQNETSHQVEAARIAHEVGLRVIYSAAPFDVAAVRAVLPYVSMLVMNAVEAAQLTTALGLSLGELPVRDIIVTKGADGADWISAGAETISARPFKVTAVDTTGAGDCFIGSLAAAIDLGMTREQAMRFASAAAAIQVTRPGTAEAMPTRAETDAFLAAHP